MGGRSACAAAFLLLAAFIVLPACGRRGPDPGGAAAHAAVIFHNATFQTPGGPVAGALAARERTILAVGPAGAILAAWKGPQTRIVDLRGGFAFPGMMDSLGNLLQLGTSLQQVDLLDTRSWKQAIERVQSRARRIPKGQWILGMGWDQNLWQGAAMPDHLELSAAVPDHPVWLLRVDALSGLANRKAMELCGISKGTPDPKGGRIERGPDGEPTGLLLRSAVDLVVSQIPQPGRGVLKARFLEAQEACAQAGLTGLFVPGLEWREVAILQELVDSGSWHLPVSASVRYRGDGGSSLGDRAPLKSYKSLLDVRCISLYLDGALGSRGAALLEPYEDDPLNPGILSYTLEEVEEAARAALEAGFQVSCHCIGDRAARLALDAFQRVFEGQARPELRWRIEHSQIVEPSDRARYPLLGVIPSMQPVHATSDMDWALSRIGEARRERAYNWRAFKDLGLRIAGGSDFPVEPCDPLKGIYAAVTMRKEDGTPPGGFLPEARLGRAEAIELFTSCAAYAVFQEDQRGTIEPGKRAHLTVYDRDLLAVPEEELPKARLLFTVIDGEVLYPRD